MEAAQKEEAMYLMDEELQPLPQRRPKVLKNTENIEVRKQNLKMMQGDVEYDVAASSTDPLGWVPEHLESILKEVTDEIDNYADANAEIMPTAAKLEEEKDVDSQTQSNDDVVKTTENDIDQYMSKRLLKVNLMPTHDSSDEEGELGQAELELYKQLQKEEPLGAVGLVEQIPDEDNATLTEENPNLCEGLLEDERLVEEVMEKIQLMEARQEQLSASLEAVAEHAARNEAYMEEIYSRSSEQLEDLLSAINKQMQDDESQEEDETEEKKE